MSPSAPILTRRRAAAGMLALAGAVSSAARALAQPAATPPTDDPPTEVTTGRDPFEHMLAPVTINGQGPFQFLMDTGANTSCISHDLAQKLMLADTTPARIHTVVGVKERPGVMIDRLQVGDRNRKAVRAATLPLINGIDGVLGVDWLDGQRLELGFKKRNISIARSLPETSRDNSVVVPARRRLGQLTIVDADLNGHSINAMIDTGSQASLCNDALREMAAAMDRRAGRTDQYPPVRMETLAGEGFSGEMFFLPFLRLGGLQMGNVPVVYSNQHVFDVWGLKGKPAVMLGMDLLTQFDLVALDFGRSQVRFDLSEAQLGPPAFAQA